MLGLEIRYAVRVLRGSPGFTAAAVLTLALGIGANTALFSVFDALLLKSLPVQDPERLAVLSIQNARGEINLEMSYPLFAELRSRNATLDDLAAGTSGSDRMQVRVPPSTEIETVKLWLVSGNYFELLGTQPVLGRLFTNEIEEARASEPTMVLSHRLWQTRFAESAGVVGQTVFVQSVPLTIVGVAAPGFFGHVVGESPDAWIPATAQPRLWSSRNYLESASVDWVRLIGRLRPDATVQSARGDLQTVYRQIEQDWKGTPHGKGLPERATLLVADGRGGFSDLRDRFERPLLMLSGVVALVLLVACINVASLLTARASSREREIAIRVAIGAGRTQLARQFLIESLLLSALGGGVGLLLGFWGTDALLPLLGGRAGLPPLDVRVDARLLGFTTFISVATGVTFGTLPVLRYLGRRSPSLGVAPSVKPPLALARSLVIVQLAVSLVLIVGAALFVRTLHNLRTVDTGFARQRVMMLRIDPFAAGYDAPRRAVLNGQLRTAISQLPGVETVSQSGIALMTGRSRTCCITVPGYTPAAGERMAIRTNDVTSEYFETVGMTRVAGRGFVQSDNLATSRPVIINEAFARKYFVGSIADSVGRSFAFGNGPAMPIVGVVADARYDGLREPSVPLVFFPAKDDAPLQSLEVRTAGNPSVVAAAVRRAISTVDPALPLRETFTIEQLVDASLARERLMARISTLLGSLVLVLACVGIYGLLAQLVVRRTNEIGIRMALGAERRQVIGIVMRETALLVVPGVVLGVTAAVLTTRITSSLLFGVMPNDPLSLVAAPVCLVVTALAAAWLPAHRAASITPLEALKRE